MGKYCWQFEHGIAYIRGRAVGSTAFYLQLASLLMTITDLHARSRDTHQHIDPASRSPYSRVCMRVYTLPMVRFARRIRSHRDTRCKGESSKQRARASVCDRERERERNGRMRGPERAKLDGKGQRGSIKKSFPLLTESLPR